MTVHMRKKITKEIYDNAMKNRGYITDEDKTIIFDVCELIGYGVYGAMAYEENGEYWCSYNRGETCD